MSTIDGLVVDQTFLERLIVMPWTRSSTTRDDKREAERLKAGPASGSMRLPRRRLFDLALAASFDDLEFRRQVNRVEEKVQLKRARLAVLESGLRAAAVMSRDVDRAREFIVDR